MAANAQTTSRVFDGSMSSSVTIAFAIAHAVCRSLGLVANDCRYEPAFACQSDVALSADDSHGSASGPAEPFVTARATARSNAFVTGTAN